jgi:spermidine synthase
MIEGSKEFRPANRRVFDDPRSTFVIDDAKSYFASSGRKFDLILSEPSNPWVSGVSGLFTQEFYERVKRQLAPNGVFGQWLHLYELNDGLVHSVLAAIDTTFAAYEIFYTSNADILVVASNSPLRDPDWTIVQYPAIAQDMRRVVKFEPEWFEVLRIGGKSVLHPMLLAHGEPNSDFFPVLDLNAEKMRFMRENATGYTELAEGRFDLVAALSGRRVGFPRELSAPTPEIDRAAALAQSTKLRFLRTKPESLTRSLPREDALREAIFRIGTMERLARSGAPSPDWHSWVYELVAVDAAMHSGTAGVVDSVFYAEMRAYVARANAPREARAAVSVLHGIGVHDWEEAAGAAKLLMASVEATPWLPPELLRNGAAVAFIKIGDLESAKQTLRDFARKTDGDRFRERIISSYLISLDPKMRKEMGWQ